jgi:hypothetical protein
MRNDILIEKGTVNLGGIKDCFGQEGVGNVCECSNRHQVFRNFLNFGRQPKFHVQFAPANFVLQGCPRRIRKRIRLIR